MTAALVRRVKARQILDSRGNSTIEVDVDVDGGFGRAGAPSGASRGKWEVQYYPRGGVLEAVRIVHDKIAPKLIGHDAEDQESIDSLLHEIDGTADFSHIGGNTAYCVSLANAISVADSKSLTLSNYLLGRQCCELPRPLGNVLGGGMHAKSGQTDVQEFLLLPMNERSFTHAALANAMVHREVAHVLQERGKPPTGKTDECAWVADLTTEEAFEVLAQATEVVSHKEGFRIGVGADIAASSLWNESIGKYVYKRDQKKLDSGEQLEFVRSLIQTFKLVYVEDPFHEEAFDQFAKLTEIEPEILICGDDLFVTNAERFKKGSKMNAGNAVIIKPNQVGTISDAKATAQLASNSEYVTITSHRSGDLPQQDLVQLAMAFGSKVIKAGAVGGQVVARLNELIRIEEELGDRADLSDLEV